MAQYIITYIGGDMPSTPKEGQAGMMKFQEWLASLGSKVVSPANPLSGTITINSDGSTKNGASTLMNGYTIVEAGSMDEALGMAKSCPFLEINGSLEVSKIMQMPS